MFAFACVDEMVTTTGSKANIYVYTCLVQACVLGNQLPRAIRTFEAMKKEGVAPDAIAYGAVINGCISAGQLDDAVRLAKDAFSNAPATVQAPALQAELVKTLQVALKRT